MPSLSRPTTPRPPAEELLAFFVRSGGVATSREVAGRLRACRCGPAPALRELVRGRRIVSFVHGGRRLVPMFQFPPAGSEPREAVGAALRELETVYDDSELAAWFARGNAWLGGLAPAELVACAPFEVLQAARADRFVARG